MSKLGLCAAVLFLMLVPVVASATTIVYDETTFLNGLASGFYLENFDALSMPVSSPHSFSGNGFTYTATAPGGLATSPFGDDSKSLSDLAEDDVLTFNFGQGVTAVGGWFTTVKNEKFNGGQLTLTLSDNTVGQPLNDPKNFLFTGFFSTTPITSLIISSGNSGKKHLAIDKLWVGSMADPVVPTPEPVSIGLAAAGFGLVALLRRRSA